MQNNENTYSAEIQKPLHSGFGAASTTEDIIKNADFAGKTAIITGGYAGIGLQTTLTLVNAGARVIVPARNVEKAVANLTGIDAEVWPMDLMDPQSINAFTERFLAENTPLHLLINNAGIMWVPLRRDSRGYESQLSTNHLGHFQLTALLWPSLKAANSARVINVSSFGHQITGFDFDDPNFEHREYQTLLGYGQSKTANILFAKELARRGAEYNVLAFSLHPGAVGGTDLDREPENPFLQSTGMYDANGNVVPEMATRLKTIPQGAATTIWCAVSDVLQSRSGAYCEDCDIAEIDNGQITHNFSEPATMRGVKPYAIDEAAAQKLWVLSEELTGISFPAN